VPVPPHSLAIAPDGTLWVSTVDSGVAAYDGTTWQQYTEADGVPAMRSNVAVALDGSVWVGSTAVYDVDGYLPATGIARFDGTTWTLFTVDDGLHANDGSVVAARDGTVWVVHDEIGPDHDSEPIRLSRFDGTSWTAYPELGDHHFGGGSGATVAADGSLWMPTTAGIIGFNGTDTTALIAPSEATPQQPAAVTLTPAPGEEPLRVSTLIGDFEFTTMEFPLGHDLKQITGTRHGLLAIDDFTTLRWSTDGVTWDGILPDDAAKITTAGDDVIVHGGGGAARYAWDGGRWAEVAILDLPGPVDHIAFGPRGAVAVGGTTVYHSVDGVHFTQAEAGPNRDSLATDNRSCVHSGPGSYGGAPDIIGPVLASDAGFVVLTPAHPDNWNRTPACEPLLWFSADGNRWDLLSPQSPFGERAIVHNIAEHAGRFVAVGAISDPGGDPVGAVWHSDDGVVWQRADVEMDAAEGIAGGDLGWILTGLNDATVRDFPSVDMWFSLDGSTWDGPYEGPEVWATAYFVPEFGVTHRHDLRGCIRDLCSRRRSITGMRSTHESIESPARVHRGGGGCPGVGLLERHWPVDAEAGHVGSRGPAAGA
jgi:hypothetical protein